MRAVAPVRRLVCRAAQPSLATCGPGAAGACSGAGAGDGASASAFVALGAAGGAAACFLASQQERRAAGGPPARCDGALPSGGRAVDAPEGYNVLAANGKRLVLSADCGGTTTRLMLHCVDPNEPAMPKQPAPGKLLAEEKYPNIAFSSLADIISLFLAQDCGVKGAKPSVAVLAVAGVVMNNQCRFTNLDWYISGRSLAKELGIPRVELINDFVAQGYGTLTLGDSEVWRLNDAAPEPGAPIACIGAGTGLGQCFLVSDSQGNYSCFPSEGAHGEFAPRGAGSDHLQIEMLSYLKVKLNGWSRIAVENVVSGTGISHIYEFLAYRSPERVDPKVHKKHLANPRDAGIIATNAWPGSLCEQTLQIFAACYGAQCGVMSLFVQPFGGLYITGGVTKKMAEWLMEEGSFMAAYQDKGRVSPLLDRVPLMIVKGDDMGQRGAHLRAVKLLQSELEGQARRLFDRMDVHGNGVLETADFKKALEDIGDQEVADRLLAELDTDNDGVVDFSEFLRGFSRMPCKLVHTICPVVDQQADISPGDLVAPKSGDVNRRSAAQMNEMLTSVAEKRSRKKSINPYEERNAPRFKTVLWKLKHQGDRSKEEDWLRREYWINKVGAICYNSATQGKVLLYAGKKDLADAAIEEVPAKEGSLRQWVFRIHPRTLKGKSVDPTEFATDSFEGMQFWLSELRALQEDAQQQVRSASEQAPPN